VRIFPSFASDLLVNSVVSFHDWLCFALSRNVFCGGFGDDEIKKQMIKQSGWKIMCVYKIFKCRVRMI